MIKLNEEVLKQITDNTRYSGYGVAELEEGKTLEATQDEEHGMAGEQFTEDELNKIGFYITYTSTEKGHILNAMSAKESRDVDIDEYYTTQGLG